MMTEEHTPGPWMAKDRAPGDPPYIGPLGAPNVCYLVANYPKRVELANARLIAAAPALLTVCKEVLTAGRYAEWSLTQGILNAAIDRAEGGTHA